MPIDWINEPWRKLYTRVTGAWLKLSVSARGLADELLKYADNNGDLGPVEDNDAGLTIAYMLGAKPREHARIKEDAAELERDRYLVIEGGQMRIRNFLEAQERRSPNALRQARHRQKQAREKQQSEGPRNASVTDDRNAPVTDTVTHPDNANVTGNETKRNETKKETEIPPELKLAHTENDPLGKPESVKQRKTVTRWLNESTNILSALNEARKQVNPRATGIKPSYESLGLIAARLDAGKTSLECLHVVDVCLDECRRDPNQFRWFNSLTPFRAEGFEMKLQQTVNGNTATKRPPEWKPPERTGEPPTQETLAALRGIGK